jgi:prepilin-type N-terminal cleavage/methylation domain-containing protein
MMRKEAGFTLIELMTVVVTIGALAGMAVMSFKDYRAKAAYGVAEQTLNDARTALEAALSEPDAVFAFTLANVAQSTPGAFTDPNANDLFPGFRLPKDVKVTVYHDPTCLDSTCLSKAVEVRHCTGIDYVDWQRFGDGVEIKLEHIAGSGC